jgi:hypothetical protein
VVSFNRNKWSVCSGIRWSITPESPLTPAQREYIKPFIDTKKYDEFRNKILFEEGDDLEGTIKIYFPSHEMECFDEYGVLLN